MDVITFTGLFIVFQSEMHIKNTFDTLKLYYEKQKPVFEKNA